MERGVRKLSELISVGPAMQGAFDQLGICSVAQLARQDPKKMFGKLCRAKGERIDVCCLDVLTAAVAQARNPKLPAEQCQWWYWNRRRKARNGKK